MSDIGHRDCIGQQINVGDWIIELNVPYSRGFIRISGFSPKSLKSLTKRGKAIYVDPQKAYKVPAEHVTLYLLRQSQNS